MMPNNLFYIFILFTFIINAQETSETLIIRGQITDSNNIPIQNVNLQYNNTGTISGQNGKYQLELIYKDSIQIILSHVSYETDTLILILNNKQKITNQNITLKETDNFLNNINLVSDEYRFKGLTKIDPTNFKKLPNTSGGIESLIKLLPGISSNNELSNQYSVRGGSYDENLIYVNGIEVYKPFLVRNGEQEGLSFINSNMIASVEFSAGGFESKFGDKLSSVLNVEYKKPTRRNTMLSMSSLGLEMNSEGRTNNYLLSYLIGMRIRSNDFLFNSLDTKGDYRPLFKDFQTYFTYQIHPDLELSLLNYYSQNKYEFTPHTREAKFGTVQEALQLTIYFEGQEVDNYETNLTALSSAYSPNDLLKLKLTSSFFRTKEQEFYDILGEYWLGELDNNIGSDQLGQVVFNRGVGSYMNHARNIFKANVFNLYHDGNYIWKINKHKYIIDWGMKYQIENINDEIREWVMVDSAGYSISPITEDLHLYQFQSGNASITSNRVSSYAQISNKVKTEKVNIHYTIGSRINYWDFNNELFISPRAMMSIQPNWKKDIIFNFSCGSYNQSPFFKEYRYQNGTLNTNIKSQKSIHYVASSDYQFEYLNRPFKFTSAIYYKQLWDIIPFEIDNLRIIYLNENNAKGYAAGLDLKLFGEFVPNVDSWISLSLLTTKEDIEGDGHGYIPRPTDRRLNASIFFQDYFPNNPNYKMQLSLIYGTGLPFGAPNTDRHEQTLRIPAYRRLDIGFSRSIKRENYQSKWKFINNFKSIWASLEIFNLIGIQNTSSYIWVSDSSNRYYAVPNYLTGRLLNLKINIKF